MKNFFSILSVSIFAFNFLMYSIFLRGTNIIPVEVFFPLLIVGSIVGFILARIGNKKGELRSLGTFGNVFMVVIAVILPYLFNTLLKIEP